MAHGIHTTRDIPRLLGLIDEEEHEHDHEHSHGHHHHHHHHHEHEKLEIPEDVEIIYREPLGADDRIVDIIIDRAFGK